MKEVAVYEAKTRLSELLAEVERGGQVTITRRGQPVARLVPPTAAASRRSSAAARRQGIADTFAQLRAARIQLDGTLKEWITEGRD